MAPDPDEGPPGETTLNEPSTAPTLPLVDLFAGCGGGSVGFKAAGFTPVAAVEIDERAAEAYEANVGIPPMVIDIRTVTGPDLLREAGLKPGACSLLFGCPPCQSFTILRKGAKATSRDRVRNTLYLEYLRLVKAVKPRHIAFENVPGMLSRRWRPHFDTLLDGLTALGYEHVWDVVDAADYGVPQHRKRVLVVASRVTAPALPKATHGPSGKKGLRRHQTVREAIGSCLALDSGEYDADDPYHAARNHSALALQRLRAIPEGGARGDLPARLQLECHKNHDGHHDIYGRMWWDRPAPTLTSGCTNVTRGRFAHPEQNRAITLREAMLLQSFPSGTVLRGTTDEMALQIGNAIPPLLARRLGECVLAMERASREGSRQESGRVASVVGTRVPTRSRASRSLASSPT